LQGPEFEQNDVHTVFLLTIFGHCVTSGVEFY
jgi:hypothetical protein